MWVNEMGDLVTQDVEKTDVLNAFFDSVFTSKTSLQESQRAWGKAGARKMYPWCRRIRSGST